MQRPKAAPGCAAQNFTTLADLSGQGIDRVQTQRARTTLVLDIDSSVSPPYGAREGTAYNGHFACAGHHPLFVFNQDGDLERCALRPGNVPAPDGHIRALGVCKCSTH